MSFHLTSAMLNTSSITRQRRGLRKPISASTVAYAGDLALLSSTSGDSPKYRARNEPNQPDCLFIANLASTIPVGLLGMNRPAMAIGCAQGLLGAASPQPRSSGCVA